MQFSLQLLQMQINRLVKNKAILFICDIQQIFAPKAYGHEGVIEASTLALKVANLFDIPIIVTQHNPKVFGKVLPALSTLFPPKHHFSEKITFSMIDQNVKSALAQYPQRNQAILIGMETHLCILQTFIDLKAMNYEVFLPADATTSLRSWERSIALQRMSKQGAILTSVESLIFELLGNYKDPNFKAIAGLLKQTGKRQKAISHL